MKFLFKKVQPLFGHFMTIPLKIRAQVCLVNFFYIRYMYFKLILVRRKVIFNADLLSITNANKTGSANPQVTKNIGLQILNPQIATFAEGP
jgi:hypothetical protein